MTSEALLARITHDPKLLNGQACIRGYRLSVAQVLDLLAAGSNPSTLCQVYPWLEDADVRACLLYARQRLTP